MEYWFISIPTLKAVNKNEAVTPINLAYSKASIANVLYALIPLAISFKIIEYCLVNAPWKKLLPI